MLMSYMQVYKVCCGPRSDECSNRYDTSAASNPFYSTRTSTTSLYSRRGSTASILSERRSSYQYGRRCSDASIVNGRRGSEPTCRKEIVFSPIHEHNEDTQVISHLESFTSTNYLEKSKTEEIKDEENDSGGSISTGNAIKLEITEVTVSPVNNKSVECREVEDPAIRNYSITTV